MLEDAGQYWNGLDGDELFSTAMDCIGRGWAILGGDGMPWAVMHCIGG